MAEIRHVEWEEFPEEYRLAILKEIKLGDCITSLPYEIPDRYLTWRVPVTILEPAIESAYKAHMLYYHPYLLTQEIEYPYMEFQRILVEKDGEILSVWEKLK